MKCTVVSLVPRKILERAPGLHPDQFELPPCKNNEIEILVIDDSFYYKPGLDDSMDRISEDGRTIARSIVLGYCNTQIAFGENCSPAFFYVEGEFSKEQIKIKYKETIEEYKKKQINWFKEIVRIGNDDFSKTGRYTSVNDLHRMAARELGLTPEWLLESPLENTKPCPVCGFALKGDFPMCFNCRSIINPKKAEELKKSGILVSA